LTRGQSREQRLPRGRWKREVKPVMMFPGYESMRHGQGGLCLSPAHRRFNQIEIWFADGVNAQHLNRICIEAGATWLDMNEPPEDGSERVMATSAAGEAQRGVSPAIQTCPL
jgi:hypothetical protein